MRQRWWRRCLGKQRRGAGGPAGDVVVVTRAGCHLCEEMLAVVSAELGPGAGPGTLDLDAALAAGQITDEQHERWTTLVPVLLVGGREVAHYRVQPGQVAALRDRGRGGRSSG